jgi:hypothetical protein
VSIFTDNFRATSQKIIYGKSADFGQNKPFPDATRVAFFSQSQLSNHLWDSGSGQVSVSTEGIVKLMEQPFRIIPRLRML